MLNCYPIADKPQRDEQLVDRIVASGFSPELLLARPRNELFKDVSIELGKAHFTEERYEILSEVAPVILERASGYSA